MVRYIRHCQNHLNYVLSVQVTWSTGAESHWKSFEIVFFDRLVPDPF